MTFTPFNPLIFFVSGNDVQTVYNGGSGHQGIRKLDLFRAADKNTLSNNAVVDGCHLTITDEIFNKHQVFRRAIVTR
jgi:hypothetical protein